MFCLKTQKGLKFLSEFSNLLSQPAHWKAKQTSVQTESRNDSPRRPTPSHPGLGVTQSHTTGEERAGTNGGKGGGRARRKESRDSRPPPEAEREASRERRAPGAWRGGGRALRCAAVRWVGGDWIGGGCSAAPGGEMAAGGGR